MRPSLGPLVFAHGLSTFVLPVRQEVRLPYDAEAVRLQLLLIGPHLRFRQTLAMDVAQGRTVGSLDRLIDHMRGPPFEGIRRDEVSERNPSKEREIRVPRDVVASAEADGDRRVERFEREQDSGDGPGGGEVCPLLFRAALLDVERRCGQVRTVVRGLERHVVREAFRLAAQAPQGRRHPPGRGRHERLRLPAEFGPARVADRMNREARPPTFRDMLRQVDDEIRGLSKRAFEVAIQVVAVEVVLGNRDQPGIPPPPRRLSAERPVRLPRCEGEEGVTLIAARLGSFGRQQTPIGHIQAPVRARDPCERANRVRRHPAIPDARRADRDGGRGENLSPDRSASDARDAGGGWSGETGGAGEAAADTGTETVPVIPASTSRGALSTGESDSSRKLYEISRPLIPRG